MKDSNTSRIRAQAVSSNQGKPRPKQGSEHFEQTSRRAPPDSEGRRILEVRVTLVVVTLECKSLPVRVVFLHDVREDSEIYSKSMEGLRSTTCNCDGFATTPPAHTRTHKIIKHVVSSATAATAF